MPAAAFPVDEVVGALLVAVSVPVPVPELVGAGSDWVDVMPIVEVLMTVLLSAGYVHASNPWSHMGDSNPQTLLGGHFQSLPLTLHSTEGAGAPPQVCRG